MLRNLASSLFLTERDKDHPVYDKELYDRPDQTPNPPAVRGRVVTTTHKAKEVRSLVERCITIARSSLEHQRAAKEFSTDAERNTEEWRSWRNSGEWQKWNNAIAPALAARRRCIQLLGDKEAVQILFDDVAPRFESRAGGYTRVLRLATCRLGDAGERAVLEFVGVRDRVTQKSERPSFADDDVATDDAPVDESDADESPADEPLADEESGADAEASAESESTDDGNEEAKKEE